MGVRSTIITRLPYDVRTELEKRLIENGFSGCIELTRWLNGLGYRISKGALNRYGLKFEEEYKVEAPRRDRLANSPRQRAPTMGPRQRLSSVF